MLSECRLVLGQATRVFLKRSSDGIRMLNLSLSLLYDDPGGAVGGGGPSSSSSGVRSLDVVCKSGAEFRLWSVGLAYLVQGPPPPASIESHRDSNRAAEERRLVWTALRRDADEATGGFPGTSPGSVRAGPKCGADPIAAAGRTGSLAGEMVVLLSRPSASVPACLATASLTPALAGVSLPMAFAEAVAASQGSKGRGNEIKLALRKARRAANDALAWGEGAWGQLGQGDDRDRDSASLVSALLGRAVRQVAAGAEHSVVLTGERRRRLRCQRPGASAASVVPRPAPTRPGPAPRSHRPPQTRWRPTCGAPGHAGGWGRAAPTRPSPRSCYARPRGAMPFGSRGWRAARGTRSPWGRRGRSGRGATTRAGS